jgi:hypothetical protein
MVRPANMVEMAWACLPFSASRLATTDPTPKKAPWGSPASSRVKNSTVLLGAKADSVLKTVKTSIRIISRRLGARLRPNTVSSGAPMTTPRA